MRSCGDERSIYDGESKTKEDESTLLNTLDNLFCLFIINDNANTALSHLAIKMENMHLYEQHQSHKMVKHTQTIRQQFGDELFECV